MAPSTVSAWVAPEATQRAALPIGYTWDTRDEKAIKGEVPECQERFVRSRHLQEGVSGADRRSEMTREERSRRSSGVPGERKPDWNHEPSQSQPGTEIAGPGKQAPRTRHASGEAWPSQVQS
ncbi:hypothetical protein NDU88_003710 [Pleurodeles waltl]|uniref:Uncharacterized protein n=1 Tax=Pleurodeles waltl TaxID=8319 RepID=A0AAV7NHQ6_PLEWA|nr:hypothetical protein NDU88_003710 [Pleurodeles waltl]